MAIIFDVSSFEKLNKLVGNSTKIKIGLFGGRYVHIGRYGQIKQIPLNKLLKKAVELEKLSLDPKNQQQAQLLFGNLKRLDQEGQQKLKNSFFLKRIFTAIKRFFGDHHTSRDEIWKRYPDPHSSCGTFIAVGPLNDCGITAPQKIEENSLKNSSTLKKDPKTPHEAVLSTHQSKQESNLELTVSMPITSSKPPPDVVEVQVEPVSEIQPKCSQQQDTPSSSGLHLNNVFPIPNPTDSPPTLKRFESSYNSGQEILDALDILMFYSEIGSDSEPPPNRSTLKSPEPISSMESIEGVKQRWWKNRQRAAPGNAQNNSSLTPQATKLEPISPSSQTNAPLQWLHPTHEIIETSIEALRQIGIDKSQIREIAIQLGQKNAKKSEDESLLVFIAIAHEKSFVEQNKEQIEQLKKHRRFISREKLNELEEAGIKQRIWYLCPSKDKSTVRLAILTPSSKKLFPLDHLEFEPLAEDLKTLGFNKHSRRKKKKKKSSV